MQFRSFFALGISVSIAACSATNGSSSVPVSRSSIAKGRTPTAKLRIGAPVSPFPTPFPDSTLLAHTPDGPHTFGDLEGGTLTGRAPTAYTVSISGVYPPFIINPAMNQIIAGNAVSFSPTNLLECIDNELDATGNANGSSITAVPVTNTNLFNFVLALGPDNISPPTQFGCRFYFEDSKLNLHRLTAYAGGPTAHPMTISNNVITLSGTYPYVNAPSQTIAVSEPDPNNAFFFGRTGSTFDGTPLCSSVDGSMVGECRDAAALTYDVNVAGSGSSIPPPHLLLQNLGAAGNHTLTLTYAGVAPSPVGSLTTMMIYDASGDYAPITVAW